jgi:hypothetical protein
VGIDLLRAGEPRPMSTRGHDVASYRLLISRAEHRPRATLVPFAVCAPMPSFRLPKGAPLIGMALLHGNRVTLDVADGGPVTVEALP